MARYRAKKSAPSQSGKLPKRPRDPFQLAKLIGDIATDQAPGGASLTGTVTPDYGDKNPAAVELGRLGGLKGGKARAKSLSARQRSRIAKKGASARWRKRS
jgi:hypothetical protein